MGWFNNKSNNDSTEKFGAIGTVNPKHKSGLNIPTDEYMKLHGCEDRLVFETNACNFELPYSRIMFIKKYDEKGKLSEHAYGTGIISIEYINKFNLRNEIICEGADFTFVDSIKELWYKANTADNGFVQI